MASIEVTKSEARKEIEQELDSVAKFNSNTPLESTESQG